MTFQTRKPTGKVAFPMILLAGEAGSGKTWASVEATSMEEVHRAFFIEIGEGQADEYGAVPGARFEIVETDGTLGSIRTAIQGASEQDAPEGKYNMLILDSATELWTMLKNEAQVAANQRKRGRKNTDGDYTIGMDLWNRANDSWAGIVRQIKAFPGPVLVTARLTITSVVDGEGRPTGAKDWKIDTQKNLPYAATVVVQARQPRTWTMTKIATTVPDLQLEPGKEVTYTDFSVATLLRTMGVGAGTEVSNWQATSTDGSLTDEAEAGRERQAQEEVQRRQYEAWEKEQMDKMVALEAEGSRDLLEKGRAYYSQNGHQRLAQMCAQIIDRMGQAAPTAVDAVENAQTILEGQVVTQ